MNEQCKTCEHNGQLICMLANHPCNPCTAYKRKTLSHDEAYAEMQRGKTVECVEGNYKGYRFKTDEYLSKTLGYWRIACVDFGAYSGYASCRFVVEDDPKLEPDKVFCFVVAKDIMERGGLVKDFKSEAWYKITGGKILKYENEKWSDVCCEYTLKDIRFICITEPREIPKKPKLEPVCAWCIEKNPRIECDRKPIYKSIILGIEKTRCQIMRAELEASRRVKAVCDPGENIVHHGSRKADPYPLTPGEAITAMEQGKEVEPEPGSGLSKRFRIYKRKIQYFSCSDTWITSGASLCDFMNKKFRIVEPVETRINYNFDGVKIVMEFRNGEAIAVIVDINGEINRLTVPE